MKDHSILRWSGSKARLLPSLLRFAPQRFNRYVEPFVGSAALYFAVQPSRAVLGDVNPEVIDVYRAIQENPHAVADALDSIPHDRAAYDVLRSIAPGHLDRPQRAARLIFLMKSCFNGVYRTNRSGHFNVPMGNRIYALPTRAQLELAHHRLRATDLVCSDFETTVKTSKSGDWVYLDPPYKPKGRYRGEFGYGARFTDECMVRLLEVARKLRSKGCFVMLSYKYDRDLVHHLADWHIHHASARRSVAGHSIFRESERELIVTSYS
ncbi:DNA adenine methylase [Ramlibacter albus]|uniref:site-specific DNA-methyltransferase (adenine-specific) n=1 Tax=Ramlibacter albus TaxID=2079448 RepID=A0A923S596_9BURK|nr:Dam family site-specific DNA-(adenine-N6)-methyltransferase [Ramlibacter albus]